MTFMPMKTASLFYAGLLAFLLCFFLSSSLKKSRFWQAFFYVLGLLMLSGAATAAYFTWGGTAVIKAGEIQTKEWFLQGGDYYVTDAVRGYAAGPNVKKRVRKTLGEKVVYDATYTTNHAGLRIAPHDMKEKDDERTGDYNNAIFMGDSFVYGEGLNDDETLPYLFENLSVGRYKVYNFGFHGYGAQQMLRIIETGLLEKTVSNQQPAVVVYEALIEHVERVSGKIIWDARVPRYKLSSSGTAEYAGTFASDPDFNENLKYSRSLSNPTNKLLATMKGPNRTQEDIKLFVQVVLQAKQLIEKAYRARFYVLVWPLGDKDAGEVMAELKKTGIDVITVDEVFKEYGDPQQQYRIEMDNHPTRLANERLAKYLLEHFE